MQNNLRFSLPDRFNLQQFIRELTQQFDIKRGKAVAETFTIYDTFDWRLYNKSLVLYVSGNKLFLRKLANIDIINSAEFTTFPVFIWNFPDGKLKNRLVVSFGKTAFT